MKIKKSHTTMRSHKFVLIALSATALVNMAVPAIAQNDHQGNVSALGRLQPQGGIIRVGAASTPEALSGSIVSTLHVKEGDDVEAGTLLAVTDSAVVLAARLKQTEAEQRTAVRAAEASRRQADEACVLADVARREAQRRVRLLDQKLASEEETEMAQGQAEASAASCTAAHANALVATSEIDVASARVTVAQAEFERAYIKAPVNGRILDVLRQPGEFVGAEGLMELGRVDKMYAIAEVYETDIVRVKVGQTATVRSDALPHALTGEVELIRHKVQKQDVTGTDPAAARDARIIEVEILLDDAEAAASLTHLQVEIIIDA
ncbi:MAG: efflux RND transporter periplasmic adaptor subunit [Xanthomonadales bacterium]|nr:efflux RND transporter periplasmic adaptor subunit [Xanthomonadales bacterium]